ncbi:MFS transporter [Thermoflavimicrobium dichotomicum]|uniref:MFS transporter, YQGE family, putative transporter n=1 Tax=Thermoflavimicrobium dichotomicum TaxID=46223 RepID=A0A1I3MSZ6_9BACL|nr:MFS transporter [Thermoflavimicrobium dichotomicum]SFJ00087.1 MFS transporter, YQGE family, putative transporter [Thermoflavimicrobium dichotomicum]
MKMFKSDAYQLDRESWLLLVMSGLYAAATSLSNMFVHVYLWKIRQDLITIGWFNFSQYLSMAIAFILAGWMAKKVDRVITIRLGVGIQAVFYLTVLLLGTKASLYAPWLGTFLGMGLGFFWLGSNVLYFEITERHNRDQYNGLNGLLGSLAGMIAPFVSGWIITRVNQFTGYRIIFGLSLAIFLAAVVVSFFLKKREAKGKFCLPPILAQAFHRKNPWFWVNCAMVAHGLREGVFVFFIGLLVYMTTRNELTLGTYFTISYLVSFISFYFIGKWLKPEWRNQAILFGAFMMGLVLVPFVWKLNSWTMFIYGIGASLFYPIYYAPLTSLVFDLIGQNEEAVKMRVEYVVLRELMLNAGRLIGLLAFIFIVNLTTNLLDLRWFLLGLGFVHVLAGITIRHVPLLKAESGSV